MVLFIYEIKYQIVLFILFMCICVLICLHVCNGIHASVFVCVFKIDSYCYQLLSSSIVLPSYSFETESLKQTMGLQKGLVSLPRLLFLFITFWSCNIGLTPMSTMYLVDGFSGFKSCPCLCGMFFNCCAILPTVTIHFLKHNTEARTGQLVENKRLCNSQI